ncbi:P4c precursor [Eptesipox virus]|uniref:P4c n=1 Tax=Eptesipox virus TaxID=1329402 RepID=A0A220T6I1_9POXV|nr:P4c precursor [Eptesipox virus]ASK51324.1 P4c precursor [Eptesipox virus]
MADLSNLWVDKKNINNNLIDLWQNDDVKKPNVNKPNILQDDDVKKPNVNKPNILQLGAVHKTTSEEDRIIKDFTKLISDTINTKIEVDKKDNKNTDVSTICINRRQRNIIRDVFRSYMLAKPSLTEEEKKKLLTDDKTNTYKPYIDTAPLQWVTESFINSNTFYAKLKKEKYKKNKNENGNIEETLEECYKNIKKTNKIDNAAVFPKPPVYYDTFNKLETLGQFILFFVFDIIEARKFRESISTRYNNNKPITLPVRFKYACEQYLLNQIKVCDKLKSKNLFIGLPMYYWFEINPADVTLIVNNITSHYKYGKQVKMFMRYLSSNGRKYISTTIGKVSLTFLDETWDFHHSVPEIVLFGLSYSVYDHLVKYGKDKLEVFIMEKNKNNKHKDGYKFITVSKNYEGYVEMPYKKAVEHEVINEDIDSRTLNNDVLMLLAADILQKAELAEAIRIIKSSDTPNHHHIHYAKRGILLAAKECKDLEDSPVDANDDGNDKDTSLLTVDSFIYMPIFYPHKDKSTNIRIHLDREIVRRLEDRYNKLSKLCCYTDIVKSLEHNFETMRQYAIILSKKADFQTYTHNDISIPIHSIDYTYPPQKEHYNNIYKRPNKYNKYNKHNNIYGFGVPIFNYRYPYIFNKYQYKYIF